MKIGAEEATIAYLRAAATVEPDADDLRVARARARTRARRPRGRRAVALAIPIVVATAGIATATGLLVNPNPRPPARTVDRAVPAVVEDTLGVFRTPSQPEDRTDEALSAARGIGAPFVVDTKSIRALGLTPLGERAYIAYARTDPGNAPSGMPLDQSEAELDGAYVVVAGRYGGLGEDGPYPLRDIERGTALGTNEIPRLGPEVPAELRSGRIITGVFPDGVRRVELVFRNGDVERHAVQDNVLIAHLAASRGEFPAAVKWLDDAGRTIRRVDF
jgi:hypothetical protein